MTLGENIARLRMAAGYSNASAFARHIGVTASTLKDWESARYKKLRVDNVLKVAKGLGCDVNELLDGVDAEYDKIVIGYRDRIRHGDPESSAAAHSGQQQGVLHDTGAALASSRRHTVEETVSRLSGLVADFSSALQDVTNRLARDMATSPARHTPSQTRKGKAHHLRGARKMG